MAEDKDNTLYYVLGALALWYWFSGSEPGNLAPEHQQVTFTPKTFIETYYPIMQQQQDEHGIPVGFNFSQLFVESSEKGYPAESKVAKNARNLYGIEADKSWTGPKYEGYRSYASYKDSIVNHSHYLKQFSNYKPLFALGVDSLAWANNIGSTGYAEDPAYSKKISTVYTKVVKPLLDEYGIRHAEQPFVPKMFRS